ncbi:hypothetical protein [Achromobacter aloeverae]|nr:hypothetical protein [Achromobacter aloeverae]
MEGDTADIDANDEANDEATDDAANKPLDKGVAPFIRVNTCRSGAIYPAH